MKVLQNIAIITVALVILASMNIFAQVVTKNSFEEPLVLIEIISVQPFDASNDDRFVVKSKERVHEAIGKIVDVFDGSKDLIGTTLPLVSSVYAQNQRGPEALTLNVLEFEGIADKELLPIGAYMILPVIRIENYDYTKYNNFGFPDRSIFFILFGTGFQLDKVMPDRFKKRLEWAKSIKQFNIIDGDKDRIDYLKKVIRSENPLLAVSAVHLFKRFYSQEAEKYFDEIILASGVPIYARLAMDHEFCLAQGQAWVNGKQKELETLLVKEALKAPEGAGLLSFRKQMIDNGSWFGGRGEREE